MVPEESTGRDRDRPGEPALRLKAGSGVTTGPGTNYGGRPSRVEQMPRAKAPWWVDAWQLLGPVFVESESGGDGARGSCSRTSNPVLAREEAASHGQRKAEGGVFKSVV